MADTYAQAANAIELLINTVFAPEQIVCIHDELHESLGSDGIYVGIAPTREAPQPGQRVTKHTYMHVQFFGLWDKEVDPAQTVDPRIITGYHSRLMDAIREAVISVGDDIWFFHWEGTDYPRDPTGNKTRFVMDLRAYSNNNALVETTG